jgi:hypothetical protein
MRARTFGPLVLFLVALGVGLVPSPLLGQSGEPGTTDIIIMSGNATPSNLQVSIGSSVNWINNDSIEHSITLEYGEDGFVFSSFALAPGDQFTAAFPDAEVVIFRSEDDPRVTGTITIGTPPPTPTTVPAATATTAAPAATATSAAATATSPAPQPTATTAAPIATATSPAQAATPTRTATRPAATPTRTATRPASTATAPGGPNATSTPRPATATPRPAIATPVPGTISTSTPAASSTTQGSEVSTATPTAQSSAVAGTPIPTPPPPSAGGLGLVAEGGTSGFVWMALLGAALMAFALSALFWAGSNKRISFEWTGRNERKK